MVYYIDTPTTSIARGNTAARPTHHAPVDVAIPLWTHSRYDQMMECIERNPSLAILEIGVARGSSPLRWMAYSDALGGEASYTGIDPFERLTEDPAEQQRLTEEKQPWTCAQTANLLERALGAPIAARTELLLGFSQQWLPGLRQTGRLYDLIFIDGGHTFPVVREDWLQCQHLLAPGGTIYFDDYPNWGVLPAVAEIDRSAWHVRVREHADVFENQPTAEYPSARRMMQLVEVTRR